MIIAVACDGSTVAQHFGHCQNFMLFTTDNSAITNAVSIPNPGHKPGFLPNFLNEQGAKVIISGGMGGGAIDIFNGLGIKVVIGACAQAKAAVQSYLDGTLISSDSVCKEHSHKDSCGGH